MSGSGFTNDVMHAENVDFSGNFPVSPTVTVDGQLLIGAALSPNIRVNTLTAGTGITISNGPGTITISSTAASTDLHAARYIVASSTAGTGANYTTIASAIAAAQGSGVNSTIFIQPGTYTENLTLVPGINLTAFMGDGLTPNVTISGTLTLTTAGTVTISGIRLQTNSAAFLAVTGSANSRVNLINCFLNCTNNTGISYTSSGASSRILISNCQSDITTTGIALFSSSGAGEMTIDNSFLANSGSSTTASTFSAGTLNLLYSNIPFAVTTSGTAAFLGASSTFGLGNTTVLTMGGSNAHTIVNSVISSGTASAISVGVALTITNSTITSSNANAITGAGTLTYSNLSFTSSSTLNTTTQTAAISLPGITRSNKQPAFLAYLPSNVNNVTGNGTAFTMGTTTALTEVFDQNGDFNTNGTFTAPYTGIYDLRSSWHIIGGTTATLMNIFLVTSNRNYELSDNKTAVANFDNEISSLCDMDVGDTCTTTAAIFGNGADDMDVVGTTFPFTYFTGCLHF